MNSFNDILESVDSLSTEDKLALAEIINKRAIEERREEIRRNADESYKEYLLGNLKPMKVDEFISTDELNRRIFELEYNINVVKFADNELDNFVESR